MGTKRVLTLTTAEVVEFRNSVLKGATPVGKRNGTKQVSRIGGPSAARASLALLKAIFNYARREGLIGPVNPCLDVGMPAAGKRTRRLSPEELANIGSLLRELEGNSRSLAAHPGRATVHADYRLAAW